MNARVQLPDDAVLEALKKLNLGCGLKVMPGYVNVDKFPSVEGAGYLDLEAAKWPWEDSSVGKVVMSHVLEHVGANPDVFVQIMKNLWRVCAHGARIHIAVPHPWHADFINDPTHVRPITAEVLGLFSMKNCLHWQKIGAANSPLAIYHGVDFELVKYEEIIDEPHWSEFKAHTITGIELRRRVRELNNVVKELRMTLRVIKPVRQSLEDVVVA